GPQPHAGLAITKTRGQRLAAIARPDDTEQALRRRIAPAHVCVRVQQDQRIPQGTSHRAQFAQLRREPPRARAIRVHGEVENRWPVPRTVWISPSSPNDSSVLRRRRMCTSTVRSSTYTLPHHTWSSNCAREYTRSACVMKKCSRRYSVGPMVTC